jgi:hypothetical protein
MQYFKVGFVLLLLVGSNFVQVLAYLTNGEPVLSYVIKYASEAAALPEVKRPIILGEERDGFKCINGFEAFQQTVIQGSQARPVVVLFFAQRQEESQRLWSQLAALTQQVSNRPDFVAVDVFQDADVDQDQKDNQNYKIAMKCLDAAGLKFSFPAVVFFSNGLMCASKQAVLMGNINPVMVSKIVEQLFIERTKGLVAAASQRVKVA